MTAREQGDTTVTLARITRYPVKGLPGTSTASAAVAPGEGLGFDRVLAIETGDSEHVEGGGWRRRGAFHHVAKNPSLVRFGTALEREGGAEAGSIDDPGAVVRLIVTDPQGTSASIRFPDPDLAPLDAAVREWFPHGRTGDAAVVAPGARLWDWENALISLINLETVAALQEHTGREVDDRRFRGNLLVSGLPAWSEFGLVGRTISIGDARFEVFQPTDRCRATAVDPLSGAVDLNVPAQLAARFGHMFCGVYLRPVAAGRIAVGDAVSVLPPGARAGVAPDAPIEAIAEWPRLATVSRREHVTDGIESLWLDDAAGLLAGAGPGQHVRVHLPDEPSPNWRNYTISAVEGASVRITVKRIGGISSVLHERFGAGTELLVSGPFGLVHDVAGTGSTATTSATSTAATSTAEHPLVLVTAGIGVTPAVAILRALVAAGSRAPVELLHVDRSQQGVAHLDEILDLVDALPNASLTLHLTGGDPDSSALATTRAGGRVRVRTGRPSHDDLAAAACRAAAGGGRGHDGAEPSRGAGRAVAEVTAHLCGPPGLLDASRRALEGAGIARERIHFDVFYTPRLTDEAPRVPPRPGPFTVDPGDGGAPIEWRPAAGALLDVAEAAGRGWPSACRSGACGTCEGALRSGTIAYLVDPVITPPDGRILTCCAVPTSDVVLGP
ncbi:MOSC domain-containing protein [Herbiconiux sp. CPCC 203407]|uniref:MOSC domain-containing protein n=1 Tax=Herbiconiux oxytropis TaxID=2970915 RepID=A0AA41XB79_9MICO|nr:MOSC domain-containing protein [Herbiconiux oxytropis]MCS5720692.1 MOSC domain-containing protein [Herbiconiux oxytropis]MCS5724981.1 MOSC domain-containing protein [Herbiconiux oxytropis]